MVACFQMYLGGVDSFNKIGLKTQYNFDGCIDFVRFNNIHLIRDAKANNRQPGFQQGRFAMNGPVDTRCIVSKRFLMPLEDRRINPIALGVAKTLLSAQKVH